MRKRTEVDGVKPDTGNAPERPNTSQPRSSNVGLPGAGSPEARAYMASVGRRPRRPTPITQPQTLVLDEDGIPRQIHRGYENDPPFDALLIEKIGNRALVEAFAEDLETVPPGHPERGKLLRYLADRRAGAPRQSMTVGVEPTDPIVSHLKEQAEAFKAELEAAKLLTDGTEPQTPR